MSHNDASLVLSEARTLLLRGWCRFALARTSLGDPCHPNDPRASCWSIHGAILRASANTGCEHLFAYVRDLAKDAVWARHRLYLAWADDSPTFDRDAAVAILDTLCLP